MLGRMCLSSRLKGWIWARVRKGAYIYLHFMVVGIYPMMFILNTSRMISRNEFSINTAPHKVELGTRVRSNLTA